MRGYEIKMSSSAQAGECDALITVALGTPLAAGGRAVADDEGVRNKDEQQCPGR